MKPVSLPKSLYPRESLARAAAAVDARVGLGSSGRRWLVSVEPAERLGEFLNEALSQSRRQARLKEARPVAAALISRLIGAGFPAAPADPLEQLEPQVRLDRAEETSALIAESKRQA